MLSALIAVSTAGEAAEGWVHAEAGLPGAVAARFEAPDDIYPHRVLGQIPEMRVLAVRGSDGSLYRRDLRDLRDQPGPVYVFEDIAPRLVDADGDGRTDVVVVRSDVAAGAQLVVYSLERGQLRAIAATPPIGQPFRWLAPVAIADLDRDGITDLAYVETPHLGKRLRVWSWAPGGLTEIAQLEGVTNHRIGEAHISGGLRDCGTGPEMILADADWTRLVSVRLSKGAVHREPLDAPATPEGFAQALSCAR